MKSRQRLGPRRRRSAADRRAGSATAVLRWSFELSPPRAGEVAPVRDSSGGPQDVPGGDRTGWERFAPLCRGRVRAIPAVRHSRQRIRSRALRRLRRRAALKDRADANIRVEGELRRDVQQAIRRKIEIGSYQGMRHVLVNGKVAVENGRLTENRAGQVLRR